MRRPTGFGEACICPRSDLHSTRLPLTGPGTVVWIRTDLKAVWVLGLADINP